MRKITSNHKQEVITHDVAGENWKIAARQFERDANNTAAIKIYETALKKHPVNAYIYDRLMVLYRKEKSFKKEMLLVTQAIKNFTELFTTRRKDPTKKISTLSKSILLAVGLADKKGSALYHPQPIARWERRKKTLANKMAAK